MHSRFQTPLPAPKSGAQTEWSSAPTLPVCSGCTWLLSTARGTVDCTRGGTDRCNPSPRHTMTAHGTQESGTYGDRSGGWPTDQASICLRPPYPGWSPSFVCVQGTFTSVTLIMYPVSHTTGGNTSNSRSQSFRHCGQDHLDSRCECSRGGGGVAGPLPQLPRKVNQGNVKFKASLSCTGQLSENLTQDKK